MNTSSKSFEQQLLWITSFVNKSDTTDKDWRLYDRLLDQLGNFFKDKMFPDLKEKDLVTVLSPTIAESKIKEHIHIS
jgi:23S rRNA A1618 N6-methylase RlmF